MPWIENSNEILSQSKISFIRRYYGVLFANTKEGRGAVRVLDKYPTYMLITNLIDQVFPDANHVWLVRDPRAVLRSVLRLQTKEFQAELIAPRIASNVIPDGFSEYLEHEFVNRSLWRLTQLHYQGISNMEALKDRCTVVHYEMMCANPRKVIGGLLKELNLCTTDVLPEKLPSNFQRYDHHENDETWSGYAAEVIQGKHDAGRELANLANELGYGRKIGQVRE